MEELNTTISNEMINSFKAFFQTIPPGIQDFLNLFFWAVLILIYAVFIWKFYRWIAKKDLLELDLRKYQKNQDSILKTIFAGILYFLEYLVILPFMVFIWFSVFTIFILILTTSLELNTILIVSVSVITAIRMTAYYQEDLSRDLAKMIPLTLLGVAIVNANIGISNALSKLTEITLLIDKIWFYLIFIIIIEFLLRFMDIAFFATIPKKEEIPKIEEFPKEATEEITKEKPQIEEN